MSGPGPAERARPRSRTRGRRAAQPGWREQAWERAAGRPFDLVVVGAGINGAGIARDAAMRGLRVLLVDKGDIGGGTSAYSTRLIHGGLRYLEFGEVGLVRESLRERETLLRIAPHLVRPVSLVIPFYRAGRYPSTLVRMGLVAYDALSFDKSLANHRFLGRDAALRRIPSLNPRGLRGAGVYYDAQAEFPERLCVENALSAARHGTVVLTHARVERFLVDAGEVRGVEIADTRTDRRLQVRAALTANVTGAWVDELTGTLDSSAPRLIGGTKGSHIVVEPFPGAPSDPLYFEAGSDARPMFVIPWHGLYLIGSTDVRFQGDLDRVVADPWEIRYFLSETNRVIEGANLTEDSVLYSYSGVRPLPYADGVPESRVTRRHIIHDHAPAVRGLISIVGGKLTTYRSLAEEAVDLIVRTLGRRAPASATGSVVLPGAAGRLPELLGWLVAERGLPEATAAHLVRIYGSRAETIAGLAAGDAELLRPLGESGRTIGAELVFALEREMAVTLEDAFLRRTMLGLAADQGRSALEAAGTVARRHLGWDEDRVRRETSSYRAALERYAREGDAAGGRPAAAS